MKVIQYDFLSLSSERPPQRSFIMCSCCTWLVMSETFNIKYPVVLHAADEGCLIMFMIYSQGIECVFMTNLQLVFLMLIGCFVCDNDLAAFVIETRPTVSRCFDQETFFSCRRLWNFPFQGGWHFTELSVLCITHFDSTLESTGFGFTLLPGLCAETRRVSYGKRRQRVFCVVTCFADLFSAF